MRASARAAIGRNEPSTIGIRHRLRRGRRGAMGRAAQRPGERSVSNAKSSRGPTQPRPSPRALVIASIALAGLAIWIIATPARNPSALVGGPFALQTGDGKTLTDADLRGQPFLVYFGYTHCPDVCPTTLAEISDVLRRMPDKPIRALFVTVDPERDTAASMADYVSSFDSRIVGLSGSRAEIDAIEKAYRVYARKGPPRADGGYSIDHSSVVYLMDAKGAFVEALDLERPPEEAAKELSAYF
jgi:protein SCO1/2